MKKAQFNNQHTTTLSYITYGWPK